MRHESVKARGVTPGNLDAGSTFRILKHRVQIVVCKRRCETNRPEVDAILSMLSRIYPRAVSR